MEQTSLEAILQRFGQPNVGRELCARPRGYGGRAIARQRDGKILAWLTKHRFATTCQVANIFFRGIKYGDVKARERLRVLYERGLLHRRSLNGKLIYYTGQWSNKVNHWLMMNEFYAELLYQKSWWQQILQCELEFAYGNIIVDVFMVAILIDKGPRQKYFIEVDHDTDLRRPQEKIIELIQLYNKQDWIKEPWADLNGEGIARFPRILIVTTTEERCKNLRRFIAEQKSPLWWKVTTMDEVIRDVWGQLV